MRGSPLCLDFVEIDNPIHCRGKVKNLKIRLKKVFKLSDKYNDYFLQRIFSLMDEDGSGLISQKIFETFVEKQIFHLGDFLSLLTFCVDIVS